MTQPHCLALDSVFPSAINNAINAAWDASDSSGGSGSAESASETNGGSSPAAAPAQSQYPALNPNYFTGQSQTSSDGLQEITVTEQAPQSFAPPALLPPTPYFSLPSFDTSAMGFNQGRGSQNNFVKAAGALVASTSLMGTGAGAVYAYGELETVELTGVGVDFMGSILLGTGAISDVGGMAIGGTALGAAGGILLIPALGVGWGIGTLLNPYVQPVISSWYGY